MITIFSVSGTKLGWHPWLSSLSQNCHHMLRLQLQNLWRIWLPLPTHTAILWSQPPSPDCSSLLHGLPASTLALYNLFSTRWCSRNSSHVMSLFSAQHSPMVTTSCREKFKMFHDPQGPMWSCLWLPFLTSSSITFLLTLFHPRWPPFWS